MYLKFDEDLYNKIVAITTTDYEKYGEFVPSENIMPMIEDLIYEIEHLKEEQEDFERNVEDNYRQITASEQAGISDREFI